MMTGRRAAVTAALIAVATIAHPPVPAARTSQAPATASIVVGGDVAKPLTVTAADLKTMPRRSATVDDHGHSIKYEGVLVSDVLARAGVPLGASLTGANLATYVVATAKDGYRVVFSLGELDPGTSGSEIIIADLADGKPLSETQGPFRIVPPHDARGARSLRMLEKIEVVRVR